MNDRYRTKRIALGLLLGITVAGIAIAGGQDESATQAGVSADGPPNYNARIEYLEGVVTVAGSDAFIGMTVEAGQTIITGPDATADIIFGTQNLLRLESDTVVVFDPETEGFSIEEGTVAAIFDKLQSIGVGPEDTFFVNTPTTVAGVRGTTFFIKIESPESTYLCTCHGILEFDEVSNRRNLRIAASRHSASRFIQTEDGVVWEEAPEIYHDSASLNTAADTIDVVIPWGEDPQ